MNTKRKETNWNSDNHKGNVSFVGSGKVSVSVASIIRSPNVQKQVSSINKIQAINLAKKESK